TVRWIAPTAQVTADPIEELHQILDDDGHVISGLTLRLCQRDWSLENPDRKRLQTAFTVGDAELYAGTCLHCGVCGQGGCVQKDILTVIAGDEAESLFVVVEPDLAGGHGRTSLCDGTEVAVHMRDYRSAYRCSRG